MTRSLFCLFCGRFKWSNMMDDDEKTTTNDIDEDMVSMMFAAGLWHMEHAHWVKFFILILIFFKQETIIVICFKIMTCVKFL